MKRALAIVSVSLLAGCSADRDPGPTPEVSPAPTTAAPVERGSATPRLALSYDGGVLVLDAGTLKTIADVPVEGFVRLNSAANGRHVLVSQSDGFAVLDMGTWTDEHGDHGHHYTAPPQLTDIRFGGTEPGHVVAHDGRLALFSDGTGGIDIVDPSVLLEGGTEPVASMTREPHHGVAVARADGSVVVSVGDEDSRSGLAILDAQGREIAATPDCPGLHGEAAAADGALTFGCEDGLLVVRRNEIRKVVSPDPYGRIGNQFGTEESAVVLGDYKTEPDAELERPQRFTLTNTTTGLLRVVPIDASYSFRSLDRGPSGEAVILGTDGALHVFDADTAQRIARHPAIGAWVEPDEWQDPMPNLHVQGDIAYVTDPEAQRLVAIDLGSGVTVAETVLDHPTIELTGVRG